MLWLIFPDLSPRRPNQASYFQLLSPPANAPSRGALLFYKKDLCFGIMFIVVDFLAIYFKLFLLYHIPPFTIWKQLEKASCILTAIVMQHLGGRGTGDQIKGHFLPGKL